MAARLEPEILITVCCIVVLITVVDKVLNSCCGLRADSSVRFSWHVVANYYTRVSRYFCVEGVLFVSPTASL